MKQLVCIPPFHLEAPSNPSEFSFQCLSARLAHASAERADQASSALERTVLMLCINHL